MKNTYYIWLVFPVSILIAGFLVLNANLQTERYLRNSNKHNLIVDSDRQGTVFHTEKALPYFLLSSAFILLILVLPRLQELSISDKTLVLKLVSEVREDVERLEEAMPPGQEVLKAAAKNDRIISIKEKTALIQHLLLKGNNKLRK